MNADTGQIYYSAEAIEAAKARGERLIPLSRDIAKTLRISQETDEEKRASFKAVAASARRRKP
ncbi:MAG: hypothetical protein ABIY70_18250 [Capsulimonas sp.]|uniref:hypothetical protein n=1 Tax=Capsulimonas sp. TaxID=2494211 RepID=UPI003264D1F6